MDFHGLRTTFATLLDEVRATDKTKEVLLRHRPLALANKRYVKVRAGHPEEVVNRMATHIGLTQLYANGMPEGQDNTDSQEV